jgi:hypothetical protein
MITGSAILIECEIIGSHGSDVSITAFWDVTPYSLVDTFNSVPKEYAVCIFRPEE